MDPDSSTGGLNENSESGELDSLPGDVEYHFNSNSRDSLSKQSMNSERTNIDALDDTARDTIIVPPLDDSSSSASLKRLPNSGLKGGEEQDHDLLDFGGDDDGEKEEGEEDDSDEGELIDEPSSPERSPGELSNHSATDLDRSGAGLEDGEVDDDVPVQGTGKKMIKTSKIREKEEPVGEELEEGEVSDDEERRTKGPMPVCRFFGKGQCTWGTNCRFLHPGVIDKGLYTMFDKVKPPPPPMPPMFPKPGLLGHAPPNFLIPPALRVEPPIIETPWERAQREAKELIKQSEKIKETDIDFEDKKMNLTLTQEEFDKENDYYVKKLGTPEREPPPEDLEPEINEWDLPSRRPSFPPKIDPNFVRDRVHHLKPPGRGLRQAPPRDSIREAPPLHEPEVRLVRESSLRSRPSRFHPADSPPPPEGRVPRRSGSYEDEPQPPRRGRERGKKDDWHDPWARPHEHKGGKRSSLSKRSRSYSSASSRSSSSSSHFSKSSKSSKSRSRSRSRSSKSSKDSPRQKRKSTENVVRKAPPRRMSPKPMRIAPPLPSKDDFGDRRDGFGFGQQNYNRPPRYAPPPPPGRGGGGGGMKDRMNAPPPSKFVKERELRGSKRPLLESWTARSSSSRSRSRSRSFSKSPPLRRGPGPKRSKFSRERSLSKSLSPRKHRSWSRSSSSSSRSSIEKFGPAPPIPKQRPFAEPEREKDRKGRIVPEKNLVVKAIKAEPKDEPRPRIKTEPQPKNKVKMTLKPSSGLTMNKSILDKLADDVMGGDDDDNSNPPSGGGHSRAASGDDEQDQQGIPGRMKQSRREELLKQLQKVEEAIAKKRSKIS